MLARQRPSNPAPLSPPRRCLRCAPPCSGPVDQVLPHFEAGLGFACPPRKDVISFLQELSTPIGQLTYATPALLAASGLTPPDQDPGALLAQPPAQLLVPVHEMAERFWGGSEWGQAMRQRTAEAGRAQEGGASALPRHGRYFNRWWLLLGLTLKCQVAINLAMRDFYVARIVQCAIFSCIIGCVPAAECRAASAGAGGRGKGRGLHRFRAIPNTAPTMLLLLLCAGASFPRSSPPSTTAGMSSPSAPSQFGDGQPASVLCAFLIPCNLCYRPVVCR